MIELTCAGLPWTVSAVNLYSSEQQRPGHFARVTSRKAGSNGLAQRTRGQEAWQKGFELSRALGRESLPDVATQGLTEPGQSEAEASAVASRTRQYQGGVAMSELSTIQAGHSRPGKQGANPN